MLYYIRDGIGDLIGFSYQDNTYYYIKNIQGDIVEILDSNYNVVARYEYDSYGNIISVKDNNGVNITDNNHIAIINPFRYRSYYYDVETKLYYLNSRYYNLLWGRFINADSYISTGQGFNGYNMYVYCNNNPIVFSDRNGNYSLKDFYNDWKGGMKIIGSGLSNSGGKISGKISKVANKFENLISKGVNFIKENFVFEVGSGVGTGIAIKASNVGISDYISDNRIVKNGKMTCSVTEVKGAGIGIFGATSVNEKLIPCNDKEIVISSFERKNYVSIGIVEFSDDSLFIGLSGELYFISGGHVKIGFEKKW